MSPGDRCQEVSTLRRLAREYSEGSLNKMQYRSRRRQAISALQFEPRTVFAPSVSQGETDGLFENSALGGLNSDVLVTALADRGASELRPGDDSAGVEAPTSGEFGSEAILERLSMSTRGSSHAEELQETDGALRAMRWRRSTSLLLALLLVILVGYVVTAY